MGILFTRRAVSALAGAVLFAASSVAQAAPLLFDFTSDSLWNGPSTTTPQTFTIGNLTATMTAFEADGSAGLLTYNAYKPAGYSGFGDPNRNRAPCADAGGPLACDSDGIGIADDEISFNTGFNASQRVRVDFSLPVFVGSVFFLDLFARNDLNDREEAIVTFDGASRSFLAQERMFENGVRTNGYVLGDMQGVLTTFLEFTTGPGNDSRGNPDYALAGFEVTVIPLPAGIWLMIGGFGLVALVRRRRTAVA